MIEWLNAMAGLWPRLLIAPLGPTVLIGTWLIGAVVGRRSDLWSELRRPDLLIGPWSVLLLLPLPATAPLPLAIDLFSALVICEWRQLCGMEQPPGGRRALMIHLALCAVFALTLDRLTFRAVEAASSVTTAAVLLVVSAWIAAACVDADEQLPGALWRMATLVVLAWLIAATVLLWWQAALFSVAALLLSRRLAAETRLRAAFSMTGIAALIAIGLRIEGFIG